jgi:hypothetical protein
LGPLGQQLIQALAKLAQPIVSFLPTAAIEDSYRHAAATAALTDYLRRCQCVVEFVDPRTIEVTTPPRSLSVRDEEIEIDAYLRVWQAMHPKPAIEVLSPRHHSTTPG